jgi:basic amino acid/polyamine antiporter, APA family
MAWKDLFATKSLERLHAEMHDDNRLRRVLGPVGLTGLGIGAIIGAGIFVLTGEVAAYWSGPSIIVSFVITFVCCALAALCYAEFAAMVPVAGSAYTYAYATLGELLAWIIGWDLILEYAMSAAVVAASWSKYFNKFTDVLFGWRVPDYLCNAPNFWSSTPFSGEGVGWVNLPAAIILLLCTVVLVIGIRESAASNTALVLLKIGVVVFVIVAGVGFFHKENWTEIPVWQRVYPEEHLFAEETNDWVKNREKLAGATAEERAETLLKEVRATHKLEIAKQNGTPEQIQKVADRYQRNLPESASDRAAVVEILRGSRAKAPAKAAERWGVLGLFGISEHLVRLDDNWRSAFMPYGISGVMFGAAMLFFVYLGFDAVSTHAEEAVNPQRDVPIGILGSLVICTILYMGVAAVLIGMVPYPDIDPETSVASAFEESKILQVLIAAGALAGMTSVLLITFLSQARIFLAMARDGLLPHNIFGVVHPRFRTPHVSTIVTGVLMAIVAAVTPIGLLEEMVNIGTYFAFIIVCAAVMLMRYRKPDVPRPFRCPAIYVVAPLGILINLAMMLFLRDETWLRLFIWLAIGLAIYFAFGSRFSTLRNQPVT